MKIWVSEALWSRLDDRERSELVEKLQLRAARAEQQERRERLQNTESTANAERNAR